MADGQTCGREPGGRNTKEMGVCPAATANLADGVNEGKNGGRICWEIAGTHCGGQVQGTWAMKRTMCLSCPFFQVVRKEELGHGFQHNLKVEDAI
jgi:hypothetical protein